MKRTARLHLVRLFLQTGYKHDSGCGRRIAYPLVILNPEVPSLQPSDTEPLVGNYFVSAYPPFSCWRPSRTDAVESILERPTSGEPIGIYVHVPFCEKRCDYCYYLSYTGTAVRVKNYLESVLAELALYMKRPAFRDRRVRFVYFGGGTPSILTPEQIRFLGANLQRLLPWNGSQDDRRSMRQTALETTFEVAPRTVRRDRLEALHEIGVNRVSMGVQSFDDALLRLNGRIHLSEDVVRAYTLIREFDFDWVNLDLMVGLLGESRAHWQDSIRRAIDLAPDSVTIYQTEIPHSTPLYRDLKEGLLKGDLVPWDVKRERLDFGFREFERSGYTVVSAYAAVRDPSRHRFRYQDYLWQGRDMLGLGVASFSYLNGVHFQNHGNLDKYQDQVEKGRLPVRRAHPLIARECLVRELILQLKWGEIRPSYFQAKFGVDLLREFSTTLGQLAEEGWLTHSSRRIGLTRAGLLRADRLLPHFYESEYRNARYW